MKLAELVDRTGTMKSTEPMPVLFVGHGSPMNALGESEITRGWKTMVEGIPTPEAILCVSAHWETCGTYVTAMPQPRTLHDFGGFPPELYRVQYPAPGSPSLAAGIGDAIRGARVQPDTGWGLDHGAWSVIRHMYPEATVPVLQLSLDYGMDAAKHYELGRELEYLRGKGILVVGSGNLVHNLRMVDWNRPDGGFDWAEEAADHFRRLIRSGDHAALADYRSLGRSVQLAVPTPEHYWPLMYVLGMKRSRDQVEFFNDQLQMGSVSMLSVRIS